MNNDPIMPTPAPIPAIIPSVMPSPSPPFEYEWIFGFSGEECASFLINVKATAQTFAGRQMVALRTLGGLMVLVLYGDRRFELLMQEDGTLFGEKQYESYIPAELLETLTPPESIFRPAAWLAPVRLNMLPATWRTSARSWVGPPQWWSSDAPDGKLLYVVHAIIDTWSEEKALVYAARGYVHYHELVSVEDGTLHPSKVAWLKYIARTTFTLDGGPHPEFTHAVTPGVDFAFIPNGMMPYMP